MSYADEHGRLERGEGEEVDDLGVEVGGSAKVEELFADEEFAVFEHFLCGGVESDEDGDHYAHEEVCWEVGVGEEGVSGVVADVVCGEGE